MMELALPWLQFAGCAAIIAYAGSALTRYGEEIADLTGLSRSWIGLVLLATATSLPELFTGVSAITLADAPNIALGDALGSCILNLALLVLLDALSPEEPVYYRVSQGHILTAAFGVILIGLVGMTIMVARAPFDATFGHVGIFTPLIVVLYFVAMRATFLHEKKLTAVPGIRQTRPKGLRPVAMRYVLAASAVGAAGAFLPFVGMEIAEQTGWQTTFVGTLFVALATSLPEFVVVLAALRRRAMDLAIGSLLGSNLFDVLVIAIDDMAYTKGNLLADVSPVHAASAMAAVIMNGVFIVALLYQPRSRFFGTMSWIGLSLLAVYLFSSYFVYLYG